MAGSDSGGVTRRWPALFLTAAVAFVLPLIVAAVTARFVQELDVLMFLPQSRLSWDFAAWCLLLAASPLTGRTRERLAWAAGTVAAVLVTAGADSSGSWLRLPLAAAPLYPSIVAVLVLALAVRKGRRTSPGARDYR
jgi:hypothetical protein